MHFDIESWVGMLRRLKQVSHIRQKSCGRSTLLMRFRVRSRQMHLSGAYADCDVDWSVKRPLHRAVANMLTLRGLGCHEPSTEEFLTQDM
jgi:hypothetical protein